MTPPPTDLDEAQTRLVIDDKLIATGWIIQDKDRLNLDDSLGIATREVFDEGNTFYKIGKCEAEGTINAFRNAINSGLLFLTNFITDFILALFQLSLVFRRRADFDRSI